MSTPTKSSALILRFDPNRPRARKPAAPANAAPATSAQSVYEKLDAVLRLPRPSAHAAVEVLMDRLLEKYAGVR